MSRRSDSQRALGFIQRRGLEFLEEYAKDLPTTFRQFGMDLSSYSPETLKLIDRYVDADFRRVVTRDSETFEKGVRGMGAFLGTVFVRNGGGEWHVPGFFGAVRIAYAPRNSWNWAYITYVRLGRIKVPVFQAARDCIEKGGRIASLYEFYQRYTQAAAPDGPRRSEPSR